MKTILLNLTILMFCTLYSQNGITGPKGEVTGAGVATELLIKYQYDIQSLLASGHKFYFGPSARLAKKLDLSKARLIITQKEVFDLDKADHIQFKKASRAKSIEDVKYIEFGSKVIFESKIGALVMKQ